jgi:hypothetical protein
VISGGPWPSPRSMAKSDRKGGVCWTVAALLDEDLCNRLGSAVEANLNGDVADAERTGPAGLLLPPLLPAATARSFAAAALGSAKVTLPLGEDEPVSCDSAEPSASERDFLAGELPESVLPLTVAERCCDEACRPEDELATADRSSVAGREVDAERVADGLEAEEAGGWPTSFDEDDREVSFGAGKAAAVCAGRGSSTLPTRNLLMRRPRPAGRVSSSPLLLPGAAEGIANFASGVYAWK